LNRYNATLYFETKQAALDAGYCDAVMVDDDVPELGYMTVITFECTSFQIDEDDESLDVDLSLLCEEVA
jgi:hypothetical protein